MNPQHEPERREPTDGDTEIASEAMSVDDADVSDKGTQEEFFKAYLAQLRARQCPGCGETELF